MRMLIAAAITMTGATVFGGSAFAACKAGYHKVTIQGNSICAIDVGGNNKLAAKPQSPQQPKRLLVSKRAAP